MKILLAEDDADFRTLLQETLSAWGYEVLAVADGATAWQALQRPEAPRLALLDWAMPGLDGVQVCRNVRGQPDKPYTYLVLLTARAGKADRVEGFQAGADDYVVKPL